MLLRLLRSIYPLLKDILLEGKSIKEATKDRKGKLLLLVGILLSLVLNYVLIPRVITLSARIVELERQLNKEIPVVSASPNIDRYDRLDYYKNRLDHFK